LTPPKAVPRQIPAGDELKRSRVNFFTRGGNADDRRLAPAFVAALEGGAHGFDITDAFEGIVDAAIVMSTITCSTGVPFDWGTTKSGGAEIFRHLKLFLIDVNGDDTLRLWP
jgi:hypothetical protein